MDAFKRNGVSERSLEYSFREGRDQLLNFYLEKNIVPSVLYSLYQGLLDKMERGPHLPSCTLYREDTQDTLKNIPIGTIFLQKDFLSFFEQAPDFEREEVQRVKCVWRLNCLEEDRIKALYFQPKTDKEEGEFVFPSGSLFKLIRFDIIRCDDGEKRIVYDLSYAGKKNLEVEKGFHLLADKITKLLEYLNRGLIVRGSRYTFSKNDIAMIKDPSMRSQEDEQNIIDILTYPWNVLTGVPINYSLPLTMVHKIDRIKVVVRNYADVYLGDLYDYHLYQKDFKLEPVVLEFDFDESPLREFTQGPNIIQLDAPRRG